MKKLPLIILSLLVVSGCSATKMELTDFAEEAVILKQTKSGDLLKSLPKATQPITVSVYEFRDKTGQHKPNDNVSEYSLAVTQGGLSILKTALIDAGDGSWFKVLERGGLKNLLQERQIISTMRQRYNGQSNKSASLPPLIYAGVILEGGIVSYDSDIITGGMGAKYMGIGADAKYRRDVVTIYLRAVSVKTGEVLLSVHSAKTIFSTALQGGLFRFVGFDKLLEIETGVTINEPPQLAVRQAIETGVYALIMEGVKKKIWRFNDKTIGNKVLSRYNKIIGEKLPSKEIVKATKIKKPIFKAKNPIQSAQKRERAVDKTQNRLYWPQNTQPKNPVVTSNQNFREKRIPQETQKQHIVYQRTLNNVKKDTENNVQTQKPLEVKKEMNTLKDKTESELLWDQHDLYWENAPKKRSNFSENIQAIRQNRQQQLQRDLNKTKQENSEKTIVNEIINNLNLPSSAIIKNN